VSAPSASDGSWSQQPMVPWRVHRRAGAARSSQCMATRLCTVVRWDRNRPNHAGTSCSRTIGPGLDHIANHAAASCQCTIWPVLVHITNHAATSCNRALWPGMGCIVKHAATICSRSFGTGVGFSINCAAASCHGTVCTGVDTRAVHAAARCKHPVEPGMGSDRNGASTSCNYTSGSIVGNEPKPAASGSTAIISANRCRCTIEQVVCLRCPFHRRPLLRSSHGGPLCAVHCRPRYAELGGG
jgi:hypothetical protein